MFIFTGCSICNYFKLLELSHHFNKVNQTKFFRKCILISETGKKNPVLWPLKKELSFLQSF